MPDNLWFNVHHVGRHSITTVKSNMMPVHYTQRWTVMVNMPTD